MRGSNGETARLRAVTERARRQAYRLDPAALMRRFGSLFEREIEARWLGFAHLAPRWQDDETVAWVLAEVRNYLEAENARAMESAARAHQLALEAEARRRAQDDRRWDRPGLKADPAFRRVIQDHSVSAVFHWTHLENLPSIIERGLRPRAYLDRLDIPYARHSYGAPRKAAEFASHLVVSLTPQHGMMQRADRPVVLRLDPAVTATEGAFYVPGNTARAEFEFSNVSRKTTAADLEALFVRAGSRELVDPWVEIWIPEAIERNQIEAILVPHPTAARLAREAVALAWWKRPPEIIEDSSLSGEPPLTLETLAAEASGSS